MKRGLSIATAATLLLQVLLFATPVAAQDTISFSYEVPQGTIVIEGPAGSTYPFTNAVPSNAIGLTCTASDKADNNKSVHVGNDITITSTAGGIFLPDVERAPGAVTVGQGTITLGSTLTTTIHLASEPNWYDRSIFSGVHVVTVTCEVPPPPTTTIPPTDAVCVPELTKFDPPTNGTQAGITASFSADGYSVSLTASRGVTITAVSVKGGSTNNGGGYETYTGGSWSNLTAPLNPNTPAEGDTFQISHVVVCGESTPTTTTPPTTTEPPPVTTTVPPTTTTQPPVTTTQPPSTTTVPPTTSTQPPVTTTNPPGVTEETECFETEDGAYSRVWEVVDGERTRVLEEGPALACTGGTVKDLRPFVAAAVLLFSLAVAALGLDRLAKEEE